jgi:DNA (cytosine-5)-methyltransferase 1
MNELALFAGAGGGILGGKLLGWTTVCAVEIDKYCRDVLLNRQQDELLPVFPIWDDIKTFNGEMWKGFVDIVSGGFPCQAFSTASHGNNTAENLWPEMLRVIGEVSPRYVMAENVSEDAIIEAQADLASCGYKTIRIPISAADLGADHNRRRWWLVADSDNESELVCSIDAEMAKLKECCKGIWQAKPREPRVSNGMANRMDRFRAIGNGQVPQAMALAWNLLSGPQATSS